MTSDSDILVIGAGMLGASIAAHLAANASVRLLEMEPRPGYHSTGRSAALFCECYGNSAIRALTRASRAFFQSPPPGFCDAGLLKPRPTLVYAGPNQLPALEQFAVESLVPEQFERLSAVQAQRLFPPLRASEVGGALLDPTSADIEVHELHQGYLRLFRSRGGTVSLDAEVIALERSAGGWSVHTRTGTIAARIVVNAAGAWAGAIGKLAGAHDIGLEPLRRTVMLIDPPPETNIESWPMLMDVEEQFYLKPDAGLLLVSPADETLSVPCDSQPEELDIAIAIDRIQQATTLEVSRVRRKWAGLRSFVRDRSPVVGYDPVQPGFFWHAALGGYGIQTAPALSELAAALVLAEGREGEASALTFDPELLRPARL